MWAVHFSAELLATTRRRAAATRVTARTGPILSLTQNLVTTRNHRTVTPSVTDRPSTSRPITLAVDTVRSTVVRSRMTMVDPTATSKRLRPQATAAVVATSVARSVACRAATNGSLRSAAKASTVRDSTTMKRRSELSCLLFVFQTTNDVIGDAVSLTNPKKTIQTTTILAVKTRTKSARRRNARSARKRRRNEARRNMVVATKIRMTMLTSVVQVLVSTGAVHALALASRSTGARRARARLPSATLEAMDNRTMPEATAKSAGMVKKARAGMVANSNLLDMVAKKNMAEAMVDMVARKAQVTEATPTALAVTAEAVKREATEDVKKSMVVKRAPAMEATLTALVATVEVARAVKNLTEMIGCLAASVVMTSPKDMAAGRTREATAKVVMERRAMAAGTRVLDC